MISKELGDIQHSKIRTELVEVNDFIKANIRIEDKNPTITREKSHNKN